MLAKTLAATQFHLEAQLIEVECDLSNSLPGCTIVGLGDRAVEQARDRIRSAFKNSNLNIPAKRITFNLAPADLPKDGTGYDLAMAVALMVSTGQVQQSKISNMLFLGELSLDGSIRAVPGALSIAELTINQGKRVLITGQDNAKQAAHLPDCQVLSFVNLRELYRYLISEIDKELLPIRKFIRYDADNTTDMADVYGQAEAKRALEIAAAGEHNIILTGPPGCGKSMLAKALADILPPLSYQEALEVTKIHNISGQNMSGLISQRPLRKPHHTSSSAALVGGGKWAMPGEVSLSHNGILFLDELAEFPRSVLEVLRQPLEDGRISIARAQHKVDYPARFLLVATSNPCPCGFYGDTIKQCICSAAALSRYKQKISGPILDRIDLHVNLKRVDSRYLTNTNLNAESTTAIYKRVQAARDIQAKRFADTLAATNGRMSNKDLTNYSNITPEAKELATTASQNLGLSARSYMRIIKVSRTIADLDKSDNIELNHLAEALQYRTP